ncbi:MOSC domain-containing protein [Virgibacillus phasianinus]|uniref:MOSC domain-containing protein n=1 Tax=Virgibacillus phasianinus TaxID=2017483 RepID=A0A220TYA0_9BACI|nr:MOSC domain-containing protein [Virgibacillus phasianinus]ASK60777.1 MOSC domain-containing protein [Virgibacillus phasianinus]
MWKRYSTVVTSILVADRQDSFVTRKISETNLEYGGVPGDLHFGLTKLAGTRELMYERGSEIFNRRQVSIVSVEECAIIAEKLGVHQVLPEWLGANIVLEGFEGLTGLTPGSRIIFPSGAGILCEGENLPCLGPGKVLQENYPNERKLSTRFIKSSLGLRGIVGIVEQPGKISAGDKAEIVAYSHSD